MIKKKYCKLCLSPFEGRKKFCSDRCGQHWHNNPLKDRNNLLFRVQRELNELQEEKREAERRKILILKWKYRNVRIEWEKEGTDNFRVYF